MALILNVHPDFVYEAMFLPLGLQLHIQPLVEEKWVYRTSSVNTQQEGNHVPHGYASTYLLY